ncbi:MAG: ABC transporter ATP-binding protein [Pseudomonadota bacterium]
MDEGQDVIAVEDLSYAYPGAQSPTVADISFAVPRGTVFGLLGPSGAGKSTVQRILTRQVRRIDQGRVSVLGQSIETWDHKLFERVGVGFELPNHYPRLTALENLDFFASFYTSPTLDGHQLLDRVGLAEAADKRVSEFSKGMQVRLNFARALLHDPELLFLDEPTTGLDPTTAELIRDEISTLRSAGKTIILTTHNMHDAERLCDQVGFLAAGRMDVIDTPKALKLKYGEPTVEVIAFEDGKQVAQRFPLEGLGQNADFGAYIKGRDIQTIHSQEASLDKVFQIVTGQSLTTSGY